MSNDVTLDMQGLWDNFSRELRNFVRKLTSKEEDAADILQNAFVKMQAQLQKGNFPRHVRGWVFQIVRNAVIDHYRSRSSQQKTKNLKREDEARIAAETNLEAEQWENKLAGCIRPFIAKLPDKYSQALAWTEMDGLSQAQVADKLGLSVSAVKSRVQRGRRMLRQAFTRCCEIHLDPRNHPVDYRVRPSEKCFCGSGETM